ncbi:MAG: primosomal protein N' [Muribaculaceae bacterium]|nr:primosomal protein N' [Muribaculaceae bacterium]
MKFVEVILPLPLNRTFTYSVPSDHEDGIGVGFRVIVQFGRRNNFYTGIVASVSTLKPDDGFEIKPIVMVLDKEPSVVYPQMKFWQWIADYYLCNLGDVYKAALPSGLKVESETMVEVNPDVEPDELLESVSEREKLLLNELLGKGKQTLADLEKGTGLKRIGGQIASMIDKGHVIISEKLVERYRPKKEVFVKFKVNPETSLDEIFTQVKGAKKQEQMVMVLLQLTREKLRAGKIPEVSRRELLEKAECTSSILNALIKKGLLENVIREIDRFKYTGRKVREIPTLTDPQSKALGEIYESWKSHDVTLLRGVTSSGKTEIYQHLIAGQMEKNNQVLMLVPEIALTTQLTQRMQAIFGDKVLIYHSKFSDATRVEIWRKVLEGKGPRLIIGARSAIFLPFSSLKMIIVDEEHESSYKQFDPAPRYQARDAAIYLSTMHGSKVLLASATPSIESYWKALQGKFGLVELLVRYNEAKLPKVVINDLTEAYKNKMMAGGFSLSTLRKIKKEIEEGHQVILFQNRRGFAPIARCSMCAWVPKCDRCDVSLTYHKHNDSLVCHYCGSEKPLPKVCPQCGQPTVGVHGFGTERIEEEIKLRVPDARISRMDLDTTRNKDSYEKIIEEFSSGKNDVLVGTQMVTKGLDFGGVSVVAVINTDSLMNLPDFRANERAYNMLEQVAGRSGRREESEGLVIFQTFDANQKIFKHLSAHDYASFFNDEIEERKKYFYPPFCRIINVYFKHKEKEAVNKEINDFASILRSRMGDRVLGPEQPSVSRIQNYYIMRLMLKIENSASMPKVKEYLRQTVNYMLEHGALKGIVFYFDVDPC